MIIAISGMIGAGKSTLSKKLASSFKNSIVLEEFGENDEIFNTYLKWIYKKKPNIDISFQAYIIEYLSDFFKKSKENWLLKNEGNKGFIFLDRFNLEHYIFAKVTLKKKENKYFEAFEALFNEIIEYDDIPDIAYFLDIDWFNFKKRIFKRGREVEIKNFQENETYFQDLLNCYKSEFILLMKKYNINYKIINTNNLTDFEVFEIVKNDIKNTII
ncbi:Deoxyguanosine kinase [Mycoplasmopsis maculosa]|uniref:Deoxyguanosine kinase n=1 Tax=Mycoplasmopsis maculosa TaxID=114885 RepID=A0A449B4D0_9BACT|nr:deoxynucleoside kinase [Mycoplasmopsis maculosa]VEU75429.1 Deoxyguanosine kinase [Mycoplasmopsis maculosa]